MFYEELMEKHNEKRRKLFEKLVTNKITSGEFLEECKKLEAKMEKEYFKFIADNRVVMTQEEILLDMGYGIKFN